MSINEDLLSIEYELAHNELRSLWESIGDRRVISLLLMDRLWLSLQLLLH